MTQSAPSAAYSPAPVIRGASSYHALALVEEGGAVGTWSWDLTTGDIAWSSGAIALLGLAPSPGPARPVPPAVIAAILVPVKADTPPNERRLALVAAYRAADASAEPALIDLAARLTGPAREEALLVARAVRHRARR